MTTPRCVTATLLLLLVVLATNASAQRSVGTAVIGAGGGSSGDGAVTLCATLGQPVIGRTKMTGTVLQQGFWYGSAQSAAVPGNPNEHAVTGATMLAATIWPNPSSGTATVFVDIPAAGPASATLHDMHGSAVRTILEGIYQPGRLDISLDATDLPSGAYTVVLTSGTRHATVLFHLVR